MLVDTCVWSLALRRRRPEGGSTVARLRELIVESRALIVGGVRQELLSGIRGQQQFEQLRDRLEAFPDVPVETADHELAAEFFNLCRAKGVQGSNTDFLLCSVAFRRDLPLFTIDTDFVLFAEHLPLRLFA